MGGPHQGRVNEVVTNMYAPTERTPPHHDFSPLYASAETIVSFNVLAWRMRRPSKVDGGKPWRALKISSHCGWHFPRRKHVL